MFFNLSCGFPPKSLYDKKGVWIILMLLWIVQAMIVSQARVNKYLQWWDKIALPSCPKDAQNMINTNCVRDLTARIKLGRKMRKSDVSRRECNFMTLSTSNQVSGVLWDSGWADGLRRWTVGCFWPQVADFISCTESCGGQKKVSQMLFMQQINKINSGLSLVNQSLIFNLFSF